MAMDASALAAAMKTQLEGALGEERVALSPEMICLAFATAIVSHIATSADVRIKSTTAGLQRDPASSDPTLAPSADVVIAGAVE